MLKYKLYDSFLVRSPLLPINIWHNTFKEDYERNILALFKNDDQLLEALYLSSPEFYNHLINLKEADKKTITSLTKYLSRISYRCTPYGLFAGVSIGVFSKSTKILKTNSPLKQRTLRPDNHFVFALVDNLLKDNEILKKLIYYSNSTIYHFEDKFRYIDYELNETSLKRNYKISDIKKSEYIEYIIENSKTGLSFSEIEKYFLGLGAEKEDIFTYIKEFINDKILLTNIHPSVTEPYSIEHVQKFLKRDNSRHKEIDQYLELSNRYLKYNGGIKSLLEMENCIKQNQEYIDIKNLFQVDLLNKYDSYDLSESIKNQIHDTITFLSTLPTQKLSGIDDFIKQFKDRYGSSEISLNEVLDPEIGLGYADYSNLLESYNDNPLLADIRFTQDHSSSGIKWDWFDELILNKYLDYLESGKEKFELHKADLPEAHKNPVINSDSFISMIKFLSNETDLKPLISFTNIGGGMVFNIVGRFAYLDQDIYNMVLKNIEEDKLLHKETIFAEILHFPEDRLGNIIQHPKFYDYEIPILSPANVSEDHIIQLTDLYLKLKDNKLILFSKKLKKPVRPKQCNAHAFRLSRVPAYKFLCDYDLYINNSSSHGFNWPSVLSNKQHLPRVWYKESILSKAIWNLTYNEIKKIDSFNPDETLKWKNKRGLPKYITLAEGDNELLLNLDEKYNMTILFEKLKKYRKLSIQEAIIDDNLLNNNEEMRANELILIFNKKNG